MAVNHSVNVSEQGTSVSTPVVAESGIPFVVGRAPVHAATDPSTVGVPVLCTSWSEAVDRLGYNEDWENFTLCEFMYSHFQLYNMQPCIFVNLLDPVTMHKSVEAKDYPVSDHKVDLGTLALNNESLVVKNSEAEINKDEDYVAYYSDGSLIVELLSSGSAYGAEQLNIAYEAVKPDSVTASDVATGMEAVELCMMQLGLTPDLLCAPGFSSDSTVAAVMASKAASINGLFRAKAVVDIPANRESGAVSYSDVLTQKTKLNVTDLNQIVCWPMAGLGDRKFHLSTHIAGLIASVDSESGAPYASPSNHTLRIDRLITDDGSEVLLTLAQANLLMGQGIVTGLNFMGGYKAWGNYTACYPTNTDVKDYFIPISRMFDWVANTVVRTFWGHLDKPMNRRLIDTIMDTTNIWLNGLTGSGYLLGARCEMLDSENPLTDLMAGILHLHIYMTPPSPAQEIDFTLEYDASYVEAALMA